MGDVLPPPLAAGGPPEWVWATLLMAGFVALSVFTMVLIRLPLRRRPPPLAPPPADDETPEQEEGK